MLSPPKHYIYFTGKGTSQYDQHLQEPADLEVTTAESEESGSSEEGEEEDEEEQQGDKAEQGEVGESTEDEVIPPPKKRKPLRRKAEDVIHILSTGKY